MTIRQFASGQASGLSPSSSQCAIRHVTENSSKTETSHMVLKLLSRRLGSQDAQDSPPSRERLLSTTSLHPSAPGLTLPEVGQLVSMENVATVELAHMLVQTTDKYRRDLGDVPDPAERCSGIIVQVVELQDSKKQRASRVDVLWDNGRLLQGYRVGFAGSSKAQAAFDLEIAAASGPGSESLLSAWEQRKSKHTTEATDPASNAAVKVEDAVISTDGEKMRQTAAEKPRWLARLGKIFTRSASSSSAA